MHYLGRIAATIFGVLYTLSPIDVVPDFIPLFGQMDDVGVIVLVVLYWLAMRNKPIETGSAPEEQVGQVIDIDPAE